MVDCGQAPMAEFVHAVDEWLTGESAELPYDVFGEIVEREEIGAIICEDWALYKWVIDKGGLDFDKCRTARAIGALELIAWRNGIMIELQPASIKEAAVAAGAEELYVTPRHENRHANDSIQHGVFYLAAHENVPPC
jgi:hypothetical protein